MRLHGRATFAIATSTALEALRSRVLLASVCLVAALIGLSVAAASVTLGDRARLVVDIGLACQSALGTLIAIVLAITSFAREFERRTAYPVLARPVPRWVFVLGKYVGVVATMTLVTAAMAAATALTVLLLGETLPTAFWASLPLVWLEMALVAALALMFSCFAVPSLAATYTGGVVIAGNLSRDIVRYADRLTEDLPSVAQALRVAYYVLPDIERLSLRVQAANRLPIPDAFVAWAALYTTAYATTCLLLAMVVFSKRKAI